MVFETIQKNIKVPLIGLRDSKIGFNAITEFDTDIDQLLEVKARDTLKNIGLEAKLPPNVRARRSVVCRKIDSYVGTHSKEELKSEINKLNQHAQVEEIVKFGSYTHVFKIEFQTVAMAKHALQNGLLCFTVRRPPSQIEAEQYIDILMCFRCYKLEEHSTNNCPTPNQIICSECTGNHSFKDCTSQIKKCVNCLGPHRTMAMMCPLKKKLIKEKREQKEQKEREKQEETYAKVAEKTSKKTIEAMSQQNTEINQLIAESGFRALVMVMDAHVYNMIQPGTYNNRLNEILKLNDIKAIKVPENPPSDILFKHIETDQTIKKIVETTRKRKEPELTTTSELELSDIDLTDDEGILDEHIGKNLEPKNAHEHKIDLIMNQQETKYESLSPKKVTQLFKAGKLKYNIRSSSEMSSELLETLIKKGKIKEMQNYIVYITPNDFRKFKSGYEKNIPTKPEKKTKAK